MIETDGGRPVENSGPIVDGPGRFGRVPGYQRSAMRAEQYYEGSVAPPILRVFSQPNTEGAIMTLPPDVITRMCVCGRTVTASRTAPYDGVSRHNRTPEHRAWWAHEREAWGEF